MICGLLLGYVCGSLLTRCLQGECRSRDWFYSSLESESIEREKQEYRF